MIRVRVISRSPVIKAGLETVLSRRFEIVEDLPEVMVTDTPVGEWGHEAHVVALTHDLSQVPALVRSGARGVLSADARPAELESAVEAVAAGLIAVASENAASVFAPSRERATADLTPRELQVLGMIATGLANKEIAYRLGVAESTVKFHAASIMAKLGAGSRTEAVAIGIRQGIVAI